MKKRYLGISARFSDLWPRSASLSKAWTGRITRASKSKHFPKTLQGGEEKVDTRQGVNANFHLLAR